MILPIYVINLDRRPDRLRAVTRDFARLGLEVERVPAVDAATVTDGELSERVNLDFQTGKMGRGSEANVLSHCRALETFLGASAPAALILEDDAKPAGDLPRYLRSLDWWPEPFGLVKLEAFGRRELFFGRECAPRRRGRQLRPIALWTAGSAGYMVNRDVARAILDRCRGVTMPIDHVLFDLRVSRLARRLRPVQVLPGLVRQRADESASDIGAMKKAMQPKGLARRWYRLRWHCMAMPRKAVVKSQAVCGRAEKAVLEFADRHPSRPCRDNLEQAAVSSKPRIGMVLPNLGGGGAERAVLTLAGALLRRGYPVDLVLLRLNGEYKRAIPDGIRLHYRKRNRTTDPTLLAHCRERRIDTYPLAVNPLATFGARLFLQRIHSGVRLSGSQIRSAIAVTRYIREIHPQLLLSALPSANCAAILGKELAKNHIPVVISIQNNVDVSDSYKGVSGEIARSVNPRANAVVAISQGVAETVVNTLDIDAQIVHVIYNPIPVSEIRSLSQQKVPHPWFQDSSVPIILNVLSEGNQKDWRTLISAFALVRREMDARLAILGNLSADYRDRISSLAREMGVEEDIAFLGFVDNPFSYMRRAALYVLSSRYEGLANVLIEAMACGTPVVSTDAPYGPAEILEGGRWGPLVPVGDAEALAAAMVGSLEGRAVSAAELQQRAGDFSTERLVPIYEELFRKVIEKGGSVAAH